MSWHNYFSVISMEEIYRFVFSNVKLAGSSRNLIDKVDRCITRTPLVNSRNCCHRFEAVFLRQYFLKGIALTVLCFHAVIHNALADTQRITDFGYDEAGNIVRIQANEQSNPPDVVSIDPPFINIGRTVTITATGTDLLGVQVSVAVPGLLISNVVAQQHQVTFNLTAQATASIGQVSINFTTALGADSQVINVAQSLPGLQTIPTPIVLPVAPQPTTIELKFNDPRPDDETYTISVENPLTATVAQTSLTIATGETSANLEMTGLTQGSTKLDVVLADKFYFFSFPVYVEPSFAGGTAIYSTGTGVGVFVEPTNSNTANPVGSLPVGIFVESALGDLANPIGSLPVGVFVESALGDLANPIGSLPVGVFVESAQGDSANPLLSLPVGIALGPLLDSVAPAQVESGSDLTLAVSGFQLQDVDSISVNPSGSINIGVFTVNPQGTQISLPVSVNSNATPGSYELIIETPQGSVKLPGRHNLGLTIPEI